MTSWRGKCWRGVRDELRLNRLDGDGLECEVLKGDNLKCDQSECHELDDD